MYFSDLNVNLKVKIFVWKIIIAYNQSMQPFLAIFHLTYRETYDNLSLNVGSKNT
jgi:hypothetical protein